MERIQKYSKAHKWSWNCKKLENNKVYMESFSRTKTKCMVDYAQPTIRTNSDHNYRWWYKQSTIKEKASKNFQRHHRLSFETKIRHLSDFSFKANNTKLSTPLKDIRSKSPWKFCVTRKTSTLLIMRILLLYLI